MKKCNLLRLLALSGIISFAVLPRQASAQWPTVDIASIKEGISTNVEMVKQSKVISDAMATAGKINSAIGDAKASVSKFAGDNLEKAQEKMKKLQEEKERIEKRKEEYEKIKKDIEEKKQAIEDYKAQAEKLKEDATGYINEAKEMKALAEEGIATVKEMKDDAVSTAQSKVSSATSAVGGSSTSADLNTTTAVTPAETQTVSSGRTAFGTTQEVAPEYQVLPPTSDAKDYGEAAVAEPISAAVSVQALTGDQLKEAQDALDQEKAELQVDAMLAETPEEKAAIEEKIKAIDAQYDNLSGKTETPAAAVSPGQLNAVPVAAEAKAVGRRPFGTLKKTAVKAVENKTVEAKNEEPAAEDSANKNEVSKTEENKTEEEQPFHRAKILDGETSTKMEVPEAHRPKILDTYKAPVAHTPKILEEAQKAGSSSGGFRKRAVQKSSAIDGGRHYASRSFSETFAFAQLSGDSVPDGTVNGVFIFSDRLAQECEVNVSDLEDEKVMDECIKKLVKAKSDNDASIAQEATAVYKTIIQETVNALVAESMAQKNVAANYETEVLDKVEEQIAQTKTTRDDTSGLSLTNMETQYLLNRILTVYSSQLSLNALKEIGNFDKSYYQDGDEEESGEEK